MDELMDSKILPQGADSANDRRLQALSFEKGAPRHRLGTGAFLIVTLLLSLGLWAGIWGVIALLFSSAG
jgi:hypothetical protein